MEKDPLAIDKEEKKRIKKELVEQKRLEKQWMADVCKCRYKHIKRKTKARTREHMYCFGMVDDAQQKKTKRVCSIAR